MKSILKNLPVILHDKKILMFAIVFGVMSLTAVLMAGKIFADYGKAEEVKSQISEMEKYLTEWQDKRHELAGEKFRPIKEDEVENVQSEILMNISGTGLEMNGLRSIKEEEKEKKNKAAANKSYELTFSGNYENTMKLLTNFRVRNVLMTIRSVNIVPEDEKFKTKVFYKIYVRNSNNTGNENPKNNSKKGGEGAKK